MKAVAYTQSLAIDAADALINIELPAPVAEGQDLLVKVEAIAVNPVDYKVRLGVAPEPGTPKVLGWDAVGEVIAIGPDVTHFQPGDKVFYAGDLTRPGSNAEFQLVDERIAGRAPRSVSVADAAALPLTSITAWELLFEHLALPQKPQAPAPNSRNVLLVTGAAGGVGSILLQLAAKLTDTTIIATASREASKSWVTKLGAHHVIDHAQPLAAQVEALGVGAITHVASLNGTAHHFQSYIEMLAPFGKIAMIDDPGAIDIGPLKMKSLSLHWEFMFARSMHQAADMQAQGELLNRVSDLVDQGQLITTTGKHLGAINAANLKAAHADLESGRVIGKIVLEGFGA